MMISYRFKEQIPNFVLVWLLNGPALETVIHLPEELQIELEDIFHV